MPDALDRSRGGTPLHAGAALRALPLQSPLRDAWPRLAAELEQRRRRARRRPLLLAAAAALLAALALPRLLAPPVDTPQPLLVQAQPQTARIAALIDESTQLEALLSATGGEQVATGASLVLRARLHQRVQLVDSLLADPDTDAAARVPLWQERVLLLRGLAGIEGSEQVLAAHGLAADSTLVLTL